ncbi:hypothetical protein EXN66_Car017252 [Channa argus]|uniref:Uncharacterized protein n=1 Tax=Channa argus TaxID=215402 RepID=A0A6G1QGJ6_CHAAH|nr:hypothetical protein EXN66_Car017252 [Channa argus]
MSGPRFGLRTSSGATLAGGEGGWVAAMPTWVMIKEAEEEVVDKDKELKTSDEVGGGSVREALTRGPTPNLWAPGPEEDIHMEFSAT